MLNYFELQIKSDKYRRKLTSILLESIWYNFFLSKQNFSRDDAYKRQGQYMSPPSVTFANVTMTNFDSCVAKYNKIF